MSNEKTVIFACSGAADVGGIADGAARSLAREGVGKMACIVGIGAHHGGNLATAREAGTILVLDGCPHACASKTLREAGFDTATHLCLAELDLGKGTSPITPENIALVTTEAKKRLA
jgi:uncharacterized metal-binding protein